MLRVINFTILAAVSCVFLGAVDEDIQKEMYKSGITRNSTKIKREETCKTDKGEPGECLPYYLCSEGMAIVDGEGIIDLRMGEEEDSCSSYLDVCCLPPDTQEENKPLEPRMDPPITSSSSCGKRNQDGLGFKLSGNNDYESEFGEFPWMVAVLRLAPLSEYKSAMYYIGGGSLIHPSVVLTAAHILNTTGLRVRAGEWDTQTDKEQYPYQERDVAEVDVHEYYNKVNVHYDAALLFLVEPFDLAPNVGLACIPNVGEPLDMNAECFATGWGKDKFGKEGRFQSIMKKVDLHLVDHNECEAKLRTTRLQKYFKLHSSFICAGGKGGKDTCTGDGGSPLVCPIQSQSNRYKQMGIVSWGVHCGVDGIPAVYADVTTIGEWIDRRLALRGLDFSVYRY